MVLCCTRSHISNSPLLPYFTCTCDDQDDACTIENFADFFLNFVRNQIDRFVKNDNKLLRNGANSIDKTIQSCSKDVISSSLPLSSDLVKEVSDLNKREIEEFPLYSSGYRRFSSTPLKSVTFHDQSSVIISNTESSKRNNKNLQDSNNKNKTKVGKSPSRQTLCLGDFILSSSSSSSSISTQSSIKQKRKLLKATSTDQKISNSSLSSVVKSNSNSPIANKVNLPKVKKRVVPTPVTITSSSNNFISPALKNENNILKFVKDEIDDRNSCTIKTERDVLKNELTTIVKEFQEDKSLQQSNFNLCPENTTSPTEAALTQDIEKISVNTININDIAQVTNKNVLDKFIAIHSILIDLNLITNILNEMAYLLNLINYDCENLSQLQKDLMSINNDSKGLELNLMENEQLKTIFKNISDRIYFAMGVLTKQKNLLALLDVTTLRTILDNESFKHLSGNLKDFLEEMYNHKIELDSVKSIHDVSFKVGCNFTNVSYQQDNDTKNNFPSSKEFIAFNKQRDMFYNILRTWENKHLSHPWDFAKELGPKIKELFTCMEHPINMAHLAKLFTSQLIILSNFSEFPDQSEMALLNVDREKLSKLHQRLIAPSNFSTDYQFPGNEIFFKEFLMLTSSVIFLEQLKIALVAELMELNNSSYEVIYLDFKSQEHEMCYNDYVVRPETISTMRMLAKFLGLVISRPFEYENHGNTLVDSKQIELRNMFRPTFDVMEVLKSSISGNKLIITLPWIAQYLFMLDHITLQLDYYQEIIYLLYELYMHLNSYSGIASGTFQLRPTSVFILRLCLDWLFERHAHISENYFNYRKTRELSVKDPLTEMLASRKNEKDSIQMRSHMTVSTNIETTLLRNSLDPLLEGILVVACPFLADFRVSIMSNKSSKCPSRTGRYRHITTKMSPEIKSESIKTQTRDKLIEAFLHSQNLSMRRTIEFIIERTTSAVIKDFQMEVLIPSKTMAINKISQKNFAQLEEAVKETLLVFSEAHKNALEVWKDKMTEMIENRVIKSLDALLPNETMNIVRNTCKSIIIEKCKIKTEDWKISNLSGLDFYSKNITSDAAKLLRTNSVTIDDTVSTDMLDRQQTKSTNLVIDITKDHQPSVIFEEFQYWLHYTVSRSEFITENALELFCKKFLDCLQIHILPESICRTSGLMIIAMIQNLIQFNENVLSDNLIERFVNIWTFYKIKKFTKNLEIDESVAEENLNKENNEEKENLIKKPKQTNIFDSFITKTFIHSLGTNSKSFNCLSNVLIKMIKRDLITIDYLNEQFVALFKVNWSNDVLKLISNVLDTVCKTISCDHNSTQDDSKSQLFMEMLADFARDLDDL